MKTSNKSWWLLSGLVLMVTACGEEPTGPADVGLDLVPAFAKGGGGKPGGGGEPSGASDIPLRVVFADGTDGILSDGNFYEHGQDFVSARIRTNGMFYFQTFAGKKRDKPIRGVTVDLSSQVGLALNSDYLGEFEADVAAAGGGWPVFTSDVTLHTRNSDGGMYTMGETLVDGGKIGFNDYGDGSAWEWRLLFGARVETPEGGVDHYEEGLCVTHPSIDMWHVSTDGAECGSDGVGVNSVTELWRVVGGVFTHVADFNTPMHLTLTRN